MDEVKKIREIWDDLIMCQKSINESYVFDERKLESNDDQKAQNKRIDINNENVGGNVDSKIEQIRKTAILLLSDIDPSLNQESYKLVKNIWDSCDKYLLKDNKMQKEQNNKINNYTDGE